MNDHEREERETEDIKRMLEAGDERCMKLLFDKFYRALCMYALRYPVSPEVAEDIVQTVFISLWTNKRGKPFEGSLRSYLFGAVTVGRFSKLGFLTNFLEQRSTRVTEVCYMFDFSKTLFYLEKI